MKTLNILFFACSMSLAFGCKKDEVVPEKPKVFYSEWKQVTFGSFGVAPKISYTAYIPEAKITKEFIDKGVFILYAGGSGLALPIPYSNALNSPVAGQFIDINYDISPGRIDIWTRDLSAIKNLKFRYVIIPDGAI